ncbi:MAG: hypothetical protein LBD21_05185, partial [Tannerellaceae bacterium]|nr:hypothetical protein [Tannerellaceae bacterium]
NFKEFTFAISFPKKILRKLQMEFPCGKLFGANSKRDRLPGRLKRLSRLPNSICGHSRPVFA